MSRTKHCIGSYHTYEAAEAALESAFAAGDVRESEQPAIVRCDNGRYAIVITVVITAWW
jgi:hypothetical protein